MQKKREKNYEIMPLETAEREINKKNVFDFLCEHEKKKSISIRLFLFSVGKSNKISFLW